MIPDVYPVGSIVVLISTSADIFQFNGSRGQFVDLVDNTTDAIRHLSVHLEIEAALDQFPAISEEFPAGFEIDGAVLYPRKLVSGTSAWQLNLDLSDTNCHIFTQP
jgi:hypothetical protein